MKNYYWLVLAMLPVMIWLGWSSQGEGELAQQHLSNDHVSADTLEPVPAAQAELLLRTTCYVCHNPRSASHDEMLAPPLAGIKQRYLREYPDRQNFVDKLSEFVYAPTREAAIMKGPVRRFGLMPKTALSQDQIVAIAGYIFDHQLEVPDWFPEHHKEKHGRAWQQH